MVLKSSVSHGTNLGYSPNLWCPVEKPLIFASSEPWFSCGNFSSLGFTSMVEAGQGIKGSFLEREVIYSKFAMLRYEMSKQIVTNRIIPHGPGVLQYSICALEHWFFLRISANFSWYR